MAAKKDNSTVVLKLVGAGLAVFVAVKLLNPKKVAAAGGGGGYAGSGGASYPSPNNSQDTSVASMLKAILDALKKQQQSGQGGQSSGLNKAGAASSGGGGSKLVDPFADGSDPGVKAGEVFNSGLPDWAQNVFETGAVDSGFEGASTYGPYVGNDGYGASILGASEYGPYAPTDYGYNSYAGWGDTESTDGPYVYSGDSTVDYGGSNYGPTVDNYSWGDSGGGSDYSSGGSTWGPYDNGSGYFDGNYSSAGSGADWYNQEYGQSYGTSGNDSSYFDSGNWDSTDWSNDWA